MFGITDIIDLDPATDASCAAIVSLLGQGAKSVAVEHNAGTCRYSQADN